MYILKLCKSSTHSSKVILLVLPTLCIRKIQTEDNPFVKQKKSPSQIVKRNYHQNYLHGAASRLAFDCDHVWTSWDSQVFSQRVT